MSIVSGDRNAKLFVWGIWLAMLIAAFICLVSYGRNIPLAEDWLMVKPLTGNESHLGRWLWQQNNEHRIPLPRLILLISLKFTKGDFRSGMVLNVVTFAFVAAAAIQVARSLRGGKTSYADAFFPIALLNISNWPNLFWSWQFTQILPTALTYIIVFVFVIEPTLTTPLAAAIAGVSLVALPFCGANGLLLVPLLAPWFIYRGFVNWYATDSKDKQRSASIISISLAAIALCLIGIYFIGYQRPTWNPPSPGLWATLQTVAKFLAYSFGAVSAYWWSFFVLIAFGIFIPTFGIVILGIVRHQGFERQRALMMLLLCGIFGVYSLAVGYGRAGLVPSQGFPIRYVMFAVPMLCIAFFIWELYGSRKWQQIVPWGLFLWMLLLLPLNTIAGFEMFGNWYDGVMDSVERDIANGIPRSLLAQRHRDSLIHWWSDRELADNMQMLYEDRVGVFAQMREDRVNNSDKNLAQ